jgi:hypothetical protein
MAGWRDEAIQLEPIVPPPAATWRSQAIPVDQGPQVVGTFGDGGRILRNPDGTMQAVSAGGATTDPATIERLMQGDSFAAITQDSFDQQTIAQNPVAARVNEFVRGVPFAGSRADEAVGLFSTQARDAMRTTTGAMQRQNPNETMALNLAGGIAGAVPMALAAAPTVAATAPASRGMTALAGGALGTLTGAAEGFIYGSGEGTTGAERMENAQQNALLGGAGGAFLGIAAPYVTAAGRGIANALRTRLTRTSDVGAIADQLGVSADAATVVRNTLRAGGDLTDAQAALARAGDDAMLADAGVPAQRLLDLAGSYPGPSSSIVRRAMRERTGAAADATTAVLDRELGMPTGVRQLVDDIRAGSKESRSSAYDQAYASEINYSAPQAFSLQAALQRVPPAAIRRAEELMRIRGEESAQIMATIADNGTVSYSQLPDVRQTHYIMQALDDVAAGTDGTGTFGRQNTYGASVEALRGQISRSLRALVPEFGAAQDLAADTVRQTKAVDLGRNLLTLPREDVARGLANATAAERTAARAGLRSYVDDLMARVQRTVADPDTETREALRALRQFSSREAQDNVRILLGTQGARDLLSELDRASTAFELRAAIAENSKTEIRRVGAQSVRDQTRGVLSTLMAGEPLNAGKLLIQAMSGETPEAIRIREMGLYAEIAQALTSIRGPRAQSALGMINRAINGQTLSDSQAQYISALLSSGAVLQARPVGTGGLSLLEGSLGPQ